MSDRRHQKNHSGLLWCRDPRASTGISLEQGIATCCREEQRLWVVMGNGRRLLLLHCLFSRRQLPPEAALRREPCCHREDDPVWPGAADAERAAVQRVWEEHCAQKDASGKPGLCAASQTFWGPVLGDGGSLAELWVAPTSAPSEEEGACTRTRGQNSMNVEHLDPVLSQERRNTAPACPCSSLQVTLCLPAHAGSPALQRDSLFNPLLMAQCGPLLPRRKGPFLFRR